MDEYQVLPGEHTFQFNHADAVCSTDSYMSMDHYYNCKSKKITPVVSTELKRHCLFFKLNQESRKVRRNFKPGYVYMFNVTGEYYYPCSDDSNIIKVDNWNVSVEVIPYDVFMAYAKRFDSLSNDWGKTH